MRFTRAWRRATAACGLAFCALVAATCGGEGGERKPNVVVILIDTLRPDHLPAWGYPHATAPYLSELASRGVVLERAHSASTWTAPATASLFTGLYPHQHGITEGFFVHMVRMERAQGEGREGAAGERGERDDPDRWEGRPESTVSLNRLPDAVATAPELFARAGYTTFGVSSNVNVTGRIGFDRGFARFADFTGPEHGKGAAAERTLEQVREWKAQMLGSEPYFLYLHFNDVHAPHRERELLYTPDATPFAAERASYDGELRYLDGVLRRIGAELGWDDDTLVCVVSDHGEEFGEHGESGHGYSVHSELMRIAMLFSWPAQLAQARRIETPVSIVDVLPTLAQLAGVAAPPGLAGTSLAPALADRGPVPERTLFALRSRQGGKRQLWAAQRGPWKLILAAKGPQLYDHSEDPFEHHNLAEERPEIVASLMEELERFRALQPVGAGAKVEVQLDDAALKALRELGYTDVK